MVTGYGTKQGAGWSIQNETDFAAEFVSPSVSMSDYAFGVSDGSSSQTSWYYKYKGTQTNPAYNAPNKSFANINTTHADNGWRLMVTKRGILFIELVQSTIVNKISARLTYIGAIKSAITDAGGINIAFFNIGHSAAQTENMFFYRNNYSHYAVESYSGLYVFGATPFVTTNSFTPSVSLVDITTRLYLTTTTGIFIGELPGIVAKLINDTSKMYGISNDTLNSRPTMQITLGYTDYRTQYMYSNGRVMLIYLDNWDF